MRQRTTGLVALGVGVFSLVIAVLLRFYAVPALEVVPKDYWTHYTATGTGTVLDTRDGSTKTDAQLTQDITIKGNLSSQDKPSNSVVWDYASELSFATSSPCVTSGTSFIGNQCPVSISNESVALDDHTAAVKAWHGDKVDDGPTQAGVAQTHPVGSYISKFPFEMSKNDYPLWDGISGTAPPAHYAGTTKIDGLTVWKYVQTIGSASAPVHIYDEPKLPASLVGDLAVTGKNPPIYEVSTTTAYIDPISGIPVAGDQQVKVTAGSLDGTETNRLTLLDADLKLDAIQVTDDNDVPKFDAGNKPVMTGPGGYTTQSVHDAKRADRILLIKNTLPLIGLILGLLLLALGVFLTLRSAAAESGPALPAGDPGSTPPTAAEEKAAEEQKEAREAAEAPTRTIPTVEEKQTE